MNYYNSKSQMGSGQPLTVAQFEQAKRQLIVDLADAISQAGQMSSEFHRMELSTIQSRVEEISSIVKQLQDEDDKRAAILEEKSQ